MLCPQGKTALSLNLTARQLRTLAPIKNQQPPQQAIFKCATDRKNKTCQ